jgi:hypothetical protein
MHRRPGAIPFVSGVRNSTLRRHGGGGLARPHSAADLEALQLRGDTPPHHRPQMRDVDRPPVQFRWGWPESVARGGMISRRGRENGVVDPDTALQPMYIEVGRSRIGYLGNFI